MSPRWDQVTVVGLAVRLARKPRRCRSSSGPEIFACWALCLARQAARTADEHDPCAWLEMSIYLCQTPSRDSASAREAQVRFTTTRRHTNQNEKEVSSVRQDESSKRGDESQQIAAWQLLYRVQHPARYLSRLQTIPSPDIEKTYPWSTVWGGTTISQVPSPAAVPLRPARQTRAHVEPPDSSGRP